MKQLLAVALGGALGSCARYLLSARIAEPGLGTFAVNIIGCFFFGLILAAGERHIILSPAARAFLLVGLLGGFTTFSAYTHDSFVMLGHGQFMRAALNAGGQVVLGLAGLWAGFTLVRGL